MLDLVVFDVERGLGRFGLVNDPLAEAALAPGGLEHLIVFFSYGGAQTHHSEYFENNFMQTSTSN